MSLYETIIRRQWEQMAERKGRPLTGQDGSGDGQGSLQGQQEGADVEERTSGPSADAPDADDDALLEKIALLSREDFVRAFRMVNSTEIELDFLRVHLASPDYTATARGLAHALGFADWRATNRIYGRFARKICKAVGIMPSTRLDVLVSFFKPPDDEYRLKLRSPVVEALKELNIAGPEDFGELDEWIDDARLVEGAAYTLRVNAYERNPVARRRCISYYGPRCCVCGFTFGDIYGEVVEDYIHVHHLRPLASVGEEYIIDPVEDLRPVCANCHAVIHQRNPPFSIEDVKSMLRRKREG